MEVHHDPYDLSRVWVRNRHDDAWLAATWTHLRISPVPCGVALWRHTFLLCQAAAGWQGC
ncbi:hypothetical protein BST44_23955 [Mycobacterium scrofulaceum]|uniref:Uncharacterized protein n=1 Tax=Mycobacterium scrofulaceum TaxID=1783 RepID=A0A1X0K565_MYCSC|nr:hypothetical protein BST44_23955 [Mycobacterium scrofulaceum]